MFNNHNDSSCSFFSDEPMFLYDYYGFKILDVNQSAITEYGFTRDELLEKTILDLGEKVSCSSNEIPEELKDKTNEIWKHRSKDGKEWFVQLTTHHFKYQDRPVKLALAHSVNHVIEQKPINVHSLPKINVIDSHFPLGIIEWDNNFNVRDWSIKAEEIFGWSREEVMGVNIFDLKFLPKRIIENTKKDFSSRIKNRQGYFSVHSLHKTKSKDKIYCKWHNALSYDSKGALTGVHSIVEDITEKKVAEKKLKDSETRFRVLTEASFVGVYMLQDEKFRYVNPRFLELSGYSEKELIGYVKPQDLVYPTDFEKFNRLKKLWNARKIDSFEVNLRVKTKGNKTIHIKTYGSTIVLDGKPAVIGVVADQTREKEAEKKLNSSIKSYQSLFDSIEDPIYIQNREGVFIMVNEGAVKTYGYDKSYFIGKTPEFLAAPGKVDLEETMSCFEKALNGETQVLQWWGRKKNGEVFPKEIKMSPGKYFGNDVVIVTSRDISEQVKREKEIKENEELFRQLFQNSPVAIAMLDKHGDVQMVNNGFTEMFGYSQKEIENLQLDKVIAPKTLQEEAIALSNKKEPFFRHTSRKKKDGTIIDLLLYGAPVTLDGELIAIYGIYVDISDRIAAEEQIKQSLHEKEILLSEIHHRVKNNLAVITGLLELQSHNLESKEAINALKDSQMRINSMALIHEKLYQSKNLSQIEFGKYAKELLDVIKRSHTMGEKPVDLIVSAEEVILPITIAIPCGLIINEVVTNALKHAFVNIENPKVDLKLHQEGSETVLSITDNGIGLPVPFEEIERNSLGVVLIKTLAQQLQANMVVTSDEKGTEYTLRFDSVFKSE